MAPKWTEETIVDVHYRLLKGQSIQSIEKETGMCSSSILRFTGHTKPDPRLSPVLLQRHTDTRVRLQELARLRYEAEQKGLPVPPLPAAAPSPPRAKRKRSEPSLSTAQTRETAMRTVSTIMKKLRPRPSKVESSSSSSTSSTSTASFLSLPATTRRTAPAVAKATIETTGPPASRGVIRPPPTTRALLERIKASLDEYEAGSDPSDERLKELLRAVMADTRIPPDETMHAGPSTSDDAASSVPSDASEQHSSSLPAAPSSSADTEDGPSEERTSPATPQRPLDAQSPAGGESGAQIGNGHVATDASVPSEAEVEEHSIEVDVALEVDAPAAPTVPSSIPVPIVLEATDHVAHPLSEATTSITLPSPTPSVNGVGVGLEPPTPEDETTADLVDGGKGVDGTAKEDSGVGVNNGLEATDAMEQSDVAEDRQLVKVAVVASLGGEVA